MLEKFSSYRFYLYALLLMLPTFAGIRVEFFLIFILAVIIGERRVIADYAVTMFRDPVKKRARNLTIGVVIIMAAAGVNKMLNGVDVLCLKDYYAPFYLFPFLVLTSSLSFNRQLFIGILLIVAGESVIGIFEYLEGVRSFTVDLGESNQIKDFSLLYNSRVYGLSGNSSILGYKLLLAFILVDYCKIKPWQDWSIRGILLIGLLISFSRMAIIVLLIYWLLRLLTLNTKLFKRAYWVKPSVQFFLLVIFASLVLYKPLLLQLTRGDHEAESVITIVKEDPKQINTCELIHARTIQEAELDPLKQGWGDRLMLSAENVQSSGRKLIWLNYINFIEDHIWFGNGSDKLMYRMWVPTTGKYKLMHAHNSILMLFSTYGIIIAGLFIAFYLYYWKGYNWLPILAILLYSMGNYGVFWGFSVMDVILLILMSHKLKLSYDNT